MNAELKHATLSECSGYRYELSRGWCQNPLIFLMLNPSTADHNIDDPTIRRCMSFAEQNGYDGIMVLNLYALRATDPKQLWCSLDPVGENNDFYLHKYARQYGSFLCAWGKNAKRDRVSQVVDILKSYNANLYCLGVNKDNSPKHPLYLAKNSKIIKWEQSQ